VDDNTFLSKEYKLGSLMMATSWKTLNVLKIFLWIHSWVKRMVTARVYRAQHKKCTSSTCCLLNIYSPCNWQVRRWRLGDSVLQEVDEPHHLGILRLVFHQWPSPHSDDISNSVQKTSTSNGRGVTIKLYQELLFEMNLPDLSQLLPILPPAWKSDNYYEVSWHQRVSWLILGDLWGVSH